MIAILFATSPEAEPFVNRHADGRFDGLEEGTHVRTDDLLVTVSGRGKINAVLATERLLRDHEVDLLLHAGGAAPVTDDVEREGLLGISFVVEGDRVNLENPTYPRMPLELWDDSLDEGTLVTQDHVAENTDEKSYWERIADVRDDTGYAVAYVAAQHGIPCHIIKGVLDTGRISGADPAHETVAEFLQRQLDAADT